MTAAPLLAPAAPHRVRSVLAAAVAACLLVLAGPVAAPASAATEPTWTFRGGGYGHGVGLSQYGARGYALDGWDAGRILAHYYAGSRTVSGGSPPLRVWLSDRTGSTSFTTSGPLPVNSDGSTVTAWVDTAGSGTSATVAVDGSGRLTMTHAGRVVAGPVTGTLLVSPEAAPASGCRVGGTTVPLACLSLATTGQQYHYGVVEFTAVGGAVRTVVRDLPLTTYLFGLAEVPSSWPREALRAQAVAARTYALRKLLRTPFRSECSCAVRSTTADQVYSGLAQQSVPTYGQRWVEAVTSTGDGVSSYDGRTPLEAVYSASSGGWTESNQGAWGSAPVPYLQGVRDDGDGVDGNPWHAWTRTYTRSQLSSWLAASSSTAVGTLESVTASGYGSTQRPTTVTLTGSTATRTVSAATFRSVVSAGAARAGAAFLPSTLFRVEQASPPSATTGTTAAPAPSGHDLPSVVRGATWYQRASYTSGPADASFVFGDPGDLPVTGDWNGDGTQTPGVFRPSTGTWYLRSGPGGGPADAGRLRFGSPGDLPVVGDWDGDGTQTPGVFRPSTGTWYLTDSLTSGRADAVVRYGSPGDLPVAGDWDGDGTDTPGVFRAGTWFLTARLDGRATTVVGYGQRGDRPVVGDWDGDGADGLGVVRSARWYLSDRAGAPARLVFGFGDVTDRPLVWG